MAARWWPGPIALTEPGDVDGQLSRLTLRFAHRERERGFVATRTQKLVTFTAMTSGTLFLLMAVLLLWTRVREGALARSSRSGDGLSLWLQVQTVRFGVAALLALLMLLAMLWKGLHASMGPVFLEASVAAAITLFVICTIALDPYYVLKLQGYDPTKVMPENASQRVNIGGVLMILGVLSTLHVGLPVRWLVLLPVDIICILLYAGMLMLETASEAGPGYAAFLACMVAIWSAGKRGTEVLERRIFIDLISERSLRCRAEFQLSRAQEEQNVARVSEEVESDRRSESMASTAPTAASSASAAAFSSGTEGSTAEDKINAIAAMGEAEHWRLDTGDVRLLPGEVLGRGSFGVVVKGIFCNIMVAVKLPLAKVTSDGITSGDLSNELRVLRYLRHPNIVSTFGAIVDTQQRRIALVLELVRGTALDAFLQPGEGGAELQSKYQILMGVCRALCYLHSRRPHIVHGDLNSNNVLVEAWVRSVRPKLLDFGLSRLLTRRPSELGGTLRWMAPEVYRGGSRPECSADMFSFGHLVAFVATGVSPMQGLSGEAIRGCLRSASVPAPAWPPDCPLAPSCGPLVEACLSPGKANRPSASQAHATFAALPAQLGLERPGAKPR